MPRLHLESVTDALSTDSVLASDLKIKQELVDEHLGDRHQRDGPTEAANSTHWCDR
ncbi:hypothetical protein [Natrialba hulunbeirensis]|uniref:hypothetical protein n=1 Tax=Natrialba hulunbeirensis TaxID=123783 RepID=UPI001F4C66F5|nr:hypothetical protein [Natrialba hulunbeirensis]